jgi:hypothetical protein
MYLPDAMRGPEGMALFGFGVDVSDPAPAADRLAPFRVETHNLVSAPLPMPGRPG